MKRWPDSDVSRLREMMAARMDPACAAYMLGRREGEVMRMIAGLRARTHA